MARHTSEARKMRRQLDKLLADVSAETGVQLTWDVTELETIELLLAAIDRKVALTDH